MSTAAACACAGSGDGSSKAEGGTGQDGAAGGNGGTAASCPGPGYADGASTVQFAHMAAEVVDSSGVPVPDLRAQACGINLCLNGTTDAAGKVTIDKDAKLLHPAFKYGDGRGYVRFALPLEGPEPVTIDLPPQTAVAFDPPETGVAFTPGTTVRSGPAALALSPDLAPVEPDPFDFDTEALQRFRAVDVPGPSFPQAVDASLGFAEVVALAPDGAVLCPAGKLALDNTAGLAAGAAVEFFLHGVEVDEAWAPYGGWAKISDGTVSADGRTVETADAGGLPQLGVVGVRLAQ